MFSYSIWNHDVCYGKWSENRSKLLTGRMSRFFGLVIVCLLLYVSDCSDLTRASFPGSLWPILNFKGGHTLPRTFSGYPNWQRLQIKRQYLYWILSESVCATIKIIFARWIISVIYPSGGVPRTGGRLWAKSLWLQELLKPLLF